MDHRFDRTVSELKQIESKRDHPNNSRFDRTVSELKPKTEFELSHLSARFDRTVSELKLIPNQPAREHLLVLIAPCRN